MNNFLKPGSITKLISRSLLRPSPNVPYYGLYRTEGDVVMKDELLVSQRRFNYHPGANVRILCVNLCFLNFLYTDFYLHCLLYMNFNIFVIFIYECLFISFLQVYHLHDRGCSLLKADCDGIVMITREKAEVDFSNSEMKKAYEHKHPDGIYKLTYNVLPLKMSQKFKLIEEV